MFGIYVKINLGGFGKKKPMYVIAQQQKITAMGSRCQYVYNYVYVSISFQWWATFARDMIRQAMICTMTHTFCFVLCFATDTFQENYYAMSAGGHDPCATKPYSAKILNSWNGIALSFLAIHFIFLTRFSVSSNAKDQPAQITYGSSKRRQN